MIDVFVFGSNLRGIHGAGAAKEAREKYGAVYGKGIGLHGNSYAIPTKGIHMETLPLDHIRKEVDNFIKFAEAHPNMRFNVTAIGTGLAGHAVEDIAPMFANVPSNVILPEKFGGNGFSW